MLKVGVEDAVCDGVLEVVVVEDCVGEGVDEADGDGLAVCDGVGLLVVLAV